MLLQINSHQIRDNAIITQLIADANVTNAKLASGIDAAKIADGSVSNTEFQYLDGVTSPIQTQLNNIANGTTLDSRYVNVTGDTMTGQLTMHDAAGTGSAPIVLTNQASSAGMKMQFGYVAMSTTNTDPGFNQNNTAWMDIANDNSIGIQGSSSSDKTKMTPGSMVVTTSGSSSTISGSASTINGSLTTNGSVALNGTAGVTVASGNTISWADAPTTGNHLTNKTYVDGQDALKVSKAGDTMTGSLLMGPGAVITFDSSYTPGNAYDSATKGYVDAAVSGLHVHNAVRVATTGDLAADYADGTADDFGGLGFGATLTDNTGGFAALVVDGYNVALGDRVLVKDQTDAKQNGIYTLTTNGDTVSVSWVLTRATDADNKDAREIAGGDFMFVERGTVNINQGFVETAIDPVIGTDDILFTQFSGVGDITPGFGLEKTGNVLNVLVDGTSIDFAAPNNLEVKDGGVTNSKVATGIDAAKIADGSVSNTEFQYINSLTSNAQTQLNANASAISTETTRATTAEGNLASALGSAGPASAIDYTSNHYVTDATDLITAVSALDAALFSNAGGASGSISDLQTVVGSTDATADYSSNRVVTDLTAGPTGDSLISAIGKLDAAFVLKAGDSMSGLLTLDAGATVPTGQVITLTDAPTAGTDAANKTYVDTQDTAIRTDLASTANGLGASLVGIEDAAGKYTSTTVEGALTEIANGTTLDSRYVNVTGDTMTGQLTLNGGLAMNFNGHTAQFSGGASGEVFQISGSDNLFTIDTQAETVVISAAGKLTTVRGSLTVNQDTTITGNLTVNGTTTHVNSTTVDIGDANIELASGVADAAHNSNGGFSVKRFDGLTQNDAVMQWNEASAWFEAGKSDDLSRLVRYEELNATTGAGQVGFDNTVSSMTATTVQGAIDELEGMIDANETSISDLQAAVGSSTGTAGLTYSSTHYVANADSLKTAIGKLDTALFNEVTDLASTANGKGASLIGIEDAGSFFTSTTVEGALAELGTNGANGPLHQGYDELLVDGTIETANASAAYDITLSNATTVAGQFIKVYVNGALQVFDNGSNGTFPTAYTKTDNSTITIKQALLTAGDVIQIHYQY